LKYIVAVTLSVFLFLDSFAQITVTIGSDEEEIYPFEINQPGLYSEWMKNDTAFSEIEIFGMGEATHGTKEFFDIKAKTFEYLVTNCNYKVFGIEASYGECNYINDYLNSGIGSIDSVMLNFSFIMWRTQEVKELILWMKNYNQQCPDSAKISFYGFDMQDIYFPLKYLIDFVKSDTLLNYQELATIVRPVISKSSPQRYAALSSKESKYQDTLRAVHSLLTNWMNKNESYLAKKYPNKKCIQLRMCVDNFEQAKNGWQERTFKENNTYRDSCMAYNVLRIHALENSKMFIWAHNGHVALSQYPGESPYAKSKPMGSFLKRELGSGYYSIGFIFNEGYFQAYTDVEKNKGDGVFKKLFYKRQYQVMWSECSVPAYEKNTLTNAFSATNVDAFFIDINASGNSIFSTTQFTYWLGAAFYGIEKSSVEIIAKKQFDGLIYINNTTRAVPLDKSSLE